MDMGRTLLYIALDSMSPYRQYDLDIRYDCVHQLSEIEEVLMSYDGYVWDALVTTGNEYEFICKLAQQYTFRVNLITHMRGEIPFAPPVNVSLVKVIEWQRVLETDPIMEDVQIYVEVQDTPSATEIEQPQQPRIEEVKAVPLFTDTHKEIRMNEEKTVQFIDDFVLGSAGYREVEEIQQQQPQQPTQVKTKPIAEIKHPVKQQESKVETTIMAEQAVKYEENPLYNKTRNIQKKLFSNQQWANHKIIGIWSPTAHCGSTSLAVNFALFLAKQRIYTTVLEAITHTPMLKTHLIRFSQLPQNWKSYASCIQEEHDPREALWLYDNVVFLPSQKDDLKYTWNPPLIEAYMTTSKIVDVTLVDIPSGALSEYTKDALQFVDEVWVMFDDDFHYFYKWKNSIQQLQRQLQVPFYGIMGKTYEFSKPKEICKEMNLPLLTSIPAINELAMQSLYKKVPLLYMDKAEQQLYDAYTTLQKHLAFDTPTSRQTASQSESFFMSPLKKLVNKLKTVNN